MALEALKIHLALYRLIYLFSSFIIRKRERFEFSTQNVKKKFPSKATENWAHHLKKKTRNKTRQKHVVYYANVWSTLTLLTKIRKIINIFLSNLLEIRLFLTDKYLTQIIIINGRQRKVTCRQIQGHTNYWNFLLHIKYALQLFQSSRPDAILTYSWRHTLIPRALALVFGFVKRKLVNFGYACLLVLICIYYIAECVSAMSFPVMWPRIQHCFFFICYFLAFLSASVIHFANL